MDLRRKFIHSVKRNWTELPLNLFLTKLFLRLLNFRVRWPLPTQSLRNSGVLIEHKQVYYPELIEFQRNLWKDSVFPNCFILNAQSIYSLENSILSTLDGILFVKNLDEAGKLYPIDGSAPIHPVVISLSSIPVIRKKTLSVQGDWVCLTSRSLSHWLFEDLPRFVEVINYLDSIGAHYQILFHPDAPGYVRELVKLIRGKEVQAIGIVEVERYWYMNISSYELVPRIDDVNKVRLFFEELIPARLQARNLKLYVSRRFSTRSMKGEDEIESFFSGIGFEILHLEGMSWSEVLSKFRSAKIIVGPHGAGLSHVIFADLNVVLVEIFDYRMKYNWFFAALTETLEVDFYRIEIEDPRELARHLDFFSNLDK